MAATIPTGYQNLGNGVWGKNIKIKGKTFQVVVNPDTEQKWLYEQNTFGNGKPLFTIDQNSKIVARSKDVNGNFVPIAEDDFSYSERRSALRSIGIDGSLLVDTLKRETTWANVQGTQPPPPDNAPGQSGNNTGGQSGSGAPPSPTSTPSSPATFGITTNEFQKKKGEEYNNNYLTYPKNISDYQDRITIVQRQYVSPDVLTNKNFDVSKVDNFGKERFYDDRFIKNLGTVTLPMPNDISETNVTAWGEDNLSSLAALVGGTALGVAKGVSEFDTEKIQNAIKDAAGEIFNGPGGETIKQLLALNAAAQISQKFGININPEAFRSRITGTAINQNLELLFQGPKLRSFGFQFKMTPRSEDEAKNIRNILKFFKKGMAPKRTTTDSTGSYFLGAPNVFDIHFKSGKGSEDLKSIGKIKTCALQQCVVNYTPDGFYAAFADKNAGGSQPIAVTMQLAFTELTPIYNEYFDLTNEDSVGFDENTLTSYV